MTYGTRGAGGFGGLANRQGALAANILRLEPSAGAREGGTRVTIIGSGFRRTGKVMVRFAATQPRTDVAVVPAEVIDFSTIVAVAPKRLFAVPAHVTVSNDGTKYTAPAMATNGGEGTYLTFEFKDGAPWGEWALDNSTMPAEGGAHTTVRLEGRFTDGEAEGEGFLEGSGLLCAYGNSTLRDKAYLGPVTFTPVLEDVDTMVQRPRDADGDDAFIRLMGPDVHYVNDITQNQTYQIQMQTGTTFKWRRFAAGSAPTGDWLPLFNSVDASSLNTYQEIEYGIKVVMLSSKTAGDVFQFDVYTTSPHIVDARYRGARQLACVAPQYDPTLPDLDVWTPGRQLELKVSSRGNSSFSEATCYDSGTGQTTTGATLLKDEDHTIYISGYYTDTAAYTYEVAYQGDGTFEAYKWSAGGARDVSETIVSANIATAPTHIDSSVYVAWANTENKTAGSYCRFTANPAFSTPFSPVTFTDGGATTTGDDAVMVVEGVYRHTESVEYEVAMAGSHSLFFYRSRPYPHGTNSDWSEWSNTLSISADPIAIGTSYDSDREEDLPTGITVRFPTGLAGKQDGDKWTFVAAAGHLVTYFAEPYVTAATAASTNADGDPGAITVTKDSYTGHARRTFTITFPSDCGTNCASFYWSIDEGPYSSSTGLSHTLRYITTGAMELAYGVSIEFSEVSGWVANNEYTFDVLPIPSSVLPLVPTPTDDIWVMGTYAISDTAPAEDAVYSVRVESGGSSFVYRKNYGAWSSSTSAASTVAIADGLVLNFGATTGLEAKTYTIDARTHISKVDSVSTPHSGTRAVAAIAATQPHESNRLRANGRENGGGGLLGNIVPDGSHQGKMNITAVPTPGYVTNSYPTVYIKILGEPVVVGVTCVRALGESDPEIDVEGTYTGDKSFVYEVETEGSDKFKWRKYPKGSTTAYATAWDEDNDMDTSTAEALDEGLSITFSALGMDAGVVFTFTAEKGHSFAYRLIGHLAWSNEIEIVGEPQPLAAGVSVHFHDHSGYSTDDIFLIQNRTIDSFGGYTGDSDGTYVVEIVDDTTIDVAIFMPDSSSTASGLATVLDISGTASYTGNSTMVYEVKIATGPTDGSPSTYKWRSYLEGHAAGPYSTPVECALFDQELSHGVSVAFGAATGHSTGDSWQLVAHKGDTFKWKGPAADATWSDSYRISSVGLVEANAHNTGSQDANIDIEAFGSYTGLEDTYYTIEILSGGKFRWKADTDRTRVHGLTAGCPETSDSILCWSHGITIVPSAVQPLTEGVYVMFTGTSSWTAGDVFHIPVKASTHHSLSHGVKIAFGSRSGYAGPWSEGLGSQNGDYWSFDVAYATPARGPLGGNTELTILGSGFLPSDGLRCKLWDDRTGISLVAVAQYDSPTRVRCVVPAHTPDVLSDPEFFGLGLSSMEVGGVYTGDDAEDDTPGLKAAAFEVEVVSDTAFKWRVNADRSTSGDLTFTGPIDFSTDWVDLSDGVRVKFGATSGYTATDRWEFYAAHFSPEVHPTVQLGTIRPGVMKSVYVSNDAGITWSAEGTALASYLFSDIYVSTEGDDLTGDGTASLPYGTLQQAVLAANAEPRAGFLYDSDVTGQRYRGAPGVGLAAHINRDQVIAYPGHYFGAGNTGLFPVGKVVTVRSAVENGAVIDCRDSRTSAVLNSADKMQTGGAVAQLGHIGLEGFVVDGCDEQIVGTTFGTAAFGREWG